MSSWSIFVNTLLISGAPVLRNGLLHCRRRDMLSLFIYIKRWGEQQRCGESESRLIAQQGVHLSIYSRLYSTKPPITFMMEYCSKRKFHAEACLPSHHLLVRGQATPDMTLRRANGAVHGGRPAAVAPRPPRAGRLSGLDSRPRNE